MRFFGVFFQVVARYFFVDVSYNYTSVDLALSVPGVCPSHSLSLALSQCSSLCLSVCLAVSLFVSLSILSLFISLAS